VLNIARAVVPEMIAVKSGKIVNVAAMNGTMGKGNMSAYSASKSVVIRGSRRGCRQGQGEIRWHRCGLQHRRRFQYGAGSA
jgi:NADP-dependent 3-hydroxy acid dehydrogenase YdfG